MSTLMIYGANGYTGHLTARVAKAAGLRPILAGRTADKVRAVAAALGFEHRTFGLDVPSTVDANLRGVGVVLHCAGPFSRTSKPMADACLRTRTHYLDVTGEIDVFQALLARDAEARDAGVMLMPGVGFDVVPSDCLASYVASKIVAPSRLRIGMMSVGGRLSHGTATTVVENLHRPTLIRRGGELVPVRTGSLTRKIDFGRGPVRAMAIPMGDLITAWRSTGVDDIQVFTKVKWRVSTGARALSYMPWLMKSGPVQRLLKRRLASAPAGPDERELETGYSVLWARADNDQGDAFEARLKTPQGYAVTAAAGLHIAQRVLAGEAPPGFQAPAGAYGHDLIMGLEGMERVDVV